MSVSNFGAMQFNGTGGETLQSQWNAAKEFAGPEGRIATMPDIVDVILDPMLRRSGLDRYWTTNSSEFVGYDPEGRLKLAVLHGSGPLSTIDSILSAYSLGEHLRDNVGAVPADVFWRVLSGEYGKPAIVDIEAYLQNNRYPFHAAMNLEMALNDEVVKARLGKRYIEYLFLLASDSARYRDENNLSLDLGGLIFKVDGGHHLTSLKHAAPQRDIAKAALLAIGPRFKTAYVGEKQIGDSLSVEIGTHAFWHGFRFLAIKSDGIGGTSIRNFDIAKVIAGPQIERLLVPNQTSDFSEPKMMKVIKAGGKLWVETLKDGASIDTGTPEFLITEIEDIGEPMTFTIETVGYHGFFKYSVSDVLRVAPSKANSYSLLDCGVSENGNRQYGVVQFHRAEIDFSKRLMTQNEVEMKPELMIELAEAA